MRPLLIVIGTLFALAGLLFMAQGSGFFPYPASSFMIDQRPWIWRGLGLLILGGVTLLLARRRH